VTIVTFAVHEVWE